MQPDRRAKIAALLESPNEGERDAARAALARITEDAPVPTMQKPMVGSKEWEKAIQEWCAVLNFCVSHLGSPLLTNAEIVKIRNVSRGRGDPWDPLLHDIYKIYNKLRAAK